MLVDSTTHDRYREAAARLLVVIKCTSDPLRLSVLKQFGGIGGEIGYPRFLKLLIIIAESNDCDGKRAVADSLAQGLRCADLPTGEMTAWGAGQVWQNGPIAENLSARTLYAAPTRRFGPIEYLTVWFCQKTQRPYLSSEAYEYALAGLLELISINAEAREKYPRKILDDLALAAEGAYTRSTRMRLQALADAWLSGEPLQHVARLAADQ
jgi:hypothetical protein